MPEPSALKRVAFSPGEFAELFGKSQIWGYRQIYAGKVTVITEHGRILIPAKEVERILDSARIYSGKIKAAIRNVEEVQSDFLMKTSASETVTFTPAEFAAVFSKERTWAYRQLYAGKVQAITELGRTMIPKSEVDRLLKEAGRYMGAKAKVRKEKPPAPAGKAASEGRKAVHASISTTRLYDRRKMKPEDSPTFKVSY